MLRLLITMIAVTLGGALVTIVEAQAPSGPATAPEGPCSSCHTCAKPTVEDRCLRSCLRPGAAQAVDQAARERAPDVVILDELEDLFLPVPFDHRGHAEMAEMTIGCAICHHYTPSGAAHPACKSCHEAATVREDMRKPGLKGAYHRQCMSCHREWSHETACGVCHQPKTGRGGALRPPSPPTKDDIVGRMHPPIPEPDTHIYATGHLRRSGTKVTFRHKEHIHRFGFRCAECHREDSCSRCHEEGKSEAGRPKTLEEHHNPCSNCHDMETPERCDHCHWKEGEPQPLRFDHARTGWPLGRHHQDRNCRLCHKTVPFAKLDRECNTCHAAWAPGNFDHAVTGQRLNQEHVEVDCEMCHIDRKFDRPPTCDECHDADEGIEFPLKRPGQVVTGSSTEIGG